jgi:glycosyltransferase involved in cell wall biosynthesis
MHGIKYVGYRMASESAIRRARAILVPSNTVRSDVENLVGRHQGIHVTYEGIAECYQQAPAWSVQGDAQHEVSPFLIYTGNLYPHKNIIVVLQALKDLPHLHLKLVGARSVFLDRTAQLAQELGVTKQVEFCGFVPDMEMVELYRQATALVQPSLSEGFGLSVLEALATGCPVITADIPIFHEIGSNWVQYVPPHDAAAWMKTIDQLSQQPPTINWRQSAQAYAQSFSWDTTAKQTMAVYDQLV